MRWSAACWLRAVLFRVDPGARSLFRGFAGASGARTRRYVHARRYPRDFVCARRLWLQLPSAVAGLEEIAAHPKIFVGYSDLTSLLTTFTDSANFVTFHGPMAAEGFCCCRRRRNHFVAERGERRGRLGDWRRFRCEITCSGNGGGNALWRMPLHSGGRAGHAL